MPRDALLPHRPRRSPPRRGRGRRSPSRPLCQHYRAELAATRPRRRTRRPPPPRSASGPRSAGSPAITARSAANAVPSTFLSGPAAGRVRRHRASASASSRRTTRASPPRSTTGDSRRRQLTAAVEQTCCAGQPAQQQAFGGPRSFFESLFGPPRERAGPAAARAGRPDADQPAGRRAAGPRLGPSAADASSAFAPATASSSRSQRARRTRRTPTRCARPSARAPRPTPSRCQASDDAIRRAVSLKGRPYATMPTPSSSSELRRAPAPASGGRELGRCSCGRPKHARPAPRRRHRHRGEGGGAVAAEDRAGPGEPGQVKPQAKPEVKPEAKPDAKAIEAEDKAAAEIGAAAPTASRGIRRHRPAIDRDRPRHPEDRGHQARGDGAERHQAHGPHHRAEHHPGAGSAQAVGARDLLRPALLRAGRGLAPGRSAAAGRQFRPVLAARQREPQRHEQRLALAPVAAFTRLRPGLPGAGVPGRAAAAAAAAAAAKAAIGDRGLDRAGDDRPPFRGLAHLARGCLRTASQNASPPPMSERREPSRTAS